jgi:hypothetical protein
MTEREHGHRGIEHPDVVTVLTWGGDLVSLSGPVRVSLSRPCAIDSTGVTLSRWPWRSILTPHERIDRFDVMVSGDEIEPVRPWAADAEWYLERLVLRTRDGKALSVWGPVSDFLSRWHGPSISGRATHLNNQLARWRASCASPMPRDAPGRPAT